MIRKGDLLKITDVKFLTDNPIIIRPLLEDILKYLKESDFMVVASEDEVPIEEEDNESQVTVFYADKSEEDGISYMTVNTKYLEKKGGDRMKGIFKFKDGDLISISGNEVLNNLNPKIDYSITPKVIVNERVNDVRYTVRYNNGHIGYWYEHELCLRDDKILLYKDIDTGAIKKGIALEYSEPIIQGSDIMVLIRTYDEDERDIRVNQNNIYPYADSLQIQRVIKDNIIIMVDNEFGGSDEMFIDINSPITLNKRTIYPTYKRYNMSIRSFISKNELFNNYYSQLNNLIEFKDLDVEEEPIYISGIDPINEEDMMRSESEKEYDRGVSDFIERPEPKMESIKNDFLDDKLRWDLLPLEEIEDVVRVYSAGAKKYGPDRWQSLENGFQRYKAALLRHLLEYEKGERVDADTGCLHLAQIVWNAIAMLYLDKNGKGLIPKDE